jgi:predicted ABC-type transport system involved in lysophospholipase L1 biosynthesis ATPase subunit
MMNAGNGVVFQAVGITKVYHMGEVDVHALRGVDLDLAGSEFIVLLGPSGSGKSTLLNILVGLDVPSSGHVYYRDRDLTIAGESALTEYRRHHIGFVFQFCSENSVPQALNPGLSRKSRTNCKTMGSAISSWGGVRSQNSE